MPLLCSAGLPMTLDMTDLNGNEKKFDSPKELLANASRCPNFAID